MEDNPAEVESSPLLYPDEGPNFTYPPKEDSSVEKHGQVFIRRPRWRITVEPLIICYVFFGFPISTILQQYIIGRLADEANITYTHNFTACDNISRDDPLYKAIQDVEAKSAYFLLNTEIITGCLAAVSAILLGGYSDKAGRKYAIVVPLVGAVLRTGVYLLVIGLDLPMEVIYVGSAIDGLSGYYFTVLMGSFAYISDITTHEERQFRIAVLDMCMILPISISSILWGYLIKVLGGFFYPAVISCAGIVIVLFYAVFFLTETVIPDPKARFFSCSHLVPTFRLFLRNENSRQQTNLLLLLTAFLFVMMPSMASIDVLFQMNLPLCWGSVLIGLQGGIDILVTFIGGLTAAKLFPRCLSEPIIAIFGGLSNVGKLVYKGFVRNTVMMFLTSAFSPFGFLFTPTLRSIMSKQVMPEEHGSLFAGIAFVETMCIVLGNLAFKPIYAQTAPIWAGFVYFVEAGFYVVSIIIMMCYIFRCKRHKAHTYHVQAEAERRGVTE